MTTEHPMQLGMVGLGRTGRNPVGRPVGDGHRCGVDDVNASAVGSLVAEGATGANDLEDFVAQLERPRNVWLMLPAAITGRILDQLSSLLEPGDVAIDGGNTYYRDDIVRARQVAPRKIGYVDCGTSGGIWGLERGYCLMIGGEREGGQRLRPQR